jgi:hypothetical protein
MLPFASTRLRCLPEFQCAPLLIALNATPSLVGPRPFAQARFIRDHAMNF